MSNLEEIPKTYKRAVEVLAQWHAEAHGDGITVFSFPDPASEVVRLLEVSSQFPETGHVTPVAMGPSKEFPFKSSVALLTPGEWDLVESRRLRLPDGWDLQKREQVWPR